MQQQVLCNAMICCDVGLCETGVSCLWEKLGFGFFYLGIIVDDGEEVACNL